MPSKHAFWPFLAGALALAGCDLDEIGFPRSTKDFHYSYPLQPGGKLSIDTFNGAVEVMGWDQEMVEIDGAKYGPSPEAADQLRIEISNRSDAIEVRVGRPVDFHGNRGARFSVKMPRKAILDHVATSNGAIVVQGASGPARLRTSNAPIRVESFDNNLDAHTSNGAIDLRDVAGEAAASTSNGRIRVENLKGPLDARTSNSSIHASLTGGASAHSVHLETSNGPVDLSLPAAFASSARVSTSNGQILLRLPPDAGAHVFARTNNASISSDFDVRAQGEFRRNTLDGVIGSGGPLLDLSTSNAPIRLLRL